MLIYRLVQDGLASEAALHGSHGQSPFTGLKGHVPIECDVPPGADGSSGAVHYGSADDAGKHIKILAFRNSRAEACPRWLVSVPVSDFCSAHWPSYSFWEVTG
jgi:hypothetical protein